MIPPQQGTQQGGAEVQYSVGKGKAVLANQAKPVGQIVQLSVAFGGVEDAADLCLNDLDEVVSEIEGLLVEQTPHHLLH